MNALVRAWLAVALILGLVAYGGAGDLVRPLLAIAVAIALIPAVINLRPQMRPPPLAWIAALFLPLITIATVQVLPLGWHHPWVEGDLALLGTVHPTWSIDPAASSEALVWLVTLAALALVVCVIARGDRVRGLADALVAVAATSALLGLCLALTAAPWPSDTQVNRVRGPFIYPNHAAAFWAACLPLAALLAHRRGGALRWGAVVVLALAILLSGSRGGILVAGVVMLPLAISLLPRQRRWWWAGAGTFLIAGWLWIIGLNEIADRFERLRGDDGVTLSGRLTIWEAAWPVITAAGALGSGGGTTIAAFRRSGDTHFADLLVNHLHSDPLEWWLEYGWLGLLVAAFAIAAALLRLRPQPGPLQDPARRPLIVGAALGLVILALHGCGDFIWHSPAVAVTGVLLLCILALSGREPQPAPSARVRIRFAGAAMIGLLLLGIGPSWRWNVSEDLARDVERLVVARRSANLPLSGAEVLERAQATPPASVRLAVTQAWLARAAGDHAGARRALDAAGRLAPGDAAAWAERALLAASTRDADHMATAIRRALAWAPTWPDLQRTALQLVADHDRLALPAEQTRAIVETVLTVDRPQPAWFFPLAAGIMGVDTLAARLDRSGPRLAISAEDWLARQGPLAEWQAMRRKTAPPSLRLPAGLALAHDRLLGAHAWEPLIPVGVEERRALAEQLSAAGLPLPTALIDSLQRDGPPWRRWARPIDLLDGATRTELALLLRSDLHRGWARAWVDRISLANRAFSGDQAVVTRDSEPSLLACLAGVHPQHAAPVGLDAALSQRAKILLARWQEWEWQDLPAVGRWSWWYGDGSGQAMITTQRWSGVVIDGEWIGWVRGTTDLAPLLGSGLKRIVLLNP